jgi:formate hydrogenlyase subunit 4
MMMVALAEGGLVLSLVGASFIAGTTNLAGMALMLPALSGGALVPLILLAVSFAIALLAENARYPVDNPATHLELTMVHEAMILEYSGKRLALVEWAASNKLLIFTAVFVNIFFPWGIAGSALTVLAIFFAKIALALISIALLESVMAKLRIFRVPDLLLSSFVLSLIAILIIVV